MHFSPLPSAISGLAGLVVGAVLTYVAPRLAAGRLEVPIPTPGARLLAPLAGPWWEGWRPKRSAAFQVLTALVFALLAARYGLAVRLVLAAISSTLLLLISYIDLEFGLVPNAVSYPGVVLSLGLSPLWPGLGLVRAVLGMLVGFTIILALYLLARGQLGMGDVKLGALIGAMRGLPGVLYALYAGVILGGVGALVYLIVLRRSRKDVMPYGPYLALGALLSYLAWPL